MLRSGAAVPHIYRHAVAQAMTFAGDKGVSSS